MPILRNFASPPKISNKKRRALVAGGGGKLFSWGHGANYGQLALEEKINRSSPVQVGALINWATPAAGTFSTICTKTDGTLWSWGQNRYKFVLGLDDSIDRSSPTQVGALTNWSKPAAGTDNSACIKTDGTLWTWGQGTYGVNGNGNANARLSPIQVGSSTTWTEVSAGAQFMLAVDNGKLFSWGRNDSGQLGVNDTVRRSSPIQIGSLTTWAKPATSGRSVSNGAVSLCTKTDGTLWSWGYNTYGRLGLGDTIDRSSPVQIGALTNWATPAAGRNHFLCVKTDGTLWAWGQDSSGGLGLLDSGNKSSPTQIGALTNWVLPSAGRDTSFCTKTDGTLWVWGGGSPYGQLGLGNTGSQSSPVQIGSSTSWLKVSAGLTHAQATESP